MRKAGVWWNVERATTSRFHSVRNAAAEPGARTSVEESRAGGGRRGVGGCRNRMRGGAVGRGGAAARAVVRHLSNAALRISATSGSRFRSMSASSSYPTPAAANTHPTPH